MASASRSAPTPPAPTTSTASGALGTNEEAKASGPVDITYEPIHEQDPHFVVWHGHRFHSGKAVSLDPNAPKNAELFAALDGNPYFTRGGEKPKRAKPGKIETPEQYRAHALEWIKTATDPDAMEERWADEAELRERVGWGSDDDALMTPIYQPKLEEMNKAKQHMA